MTERILFVENKAAWYCRDAMPLGRKMKILLIALGLMLPLVLVVWGIYIV
jgi:hypothetical protein